MSKSENDPLIKSIRHSDHLEDGDVVTDIINDSSAIGLYRNFVMMSVAFSCNHGAVVSCLAYSTTELGNSLGGYGSGTLYVLYALTAFLLSKPIVSMIGPKLGLLAGVGGYCVYVGGFLFAILVPALAYPVFIAACAIGGIAGGLLWTSQGKYFAKNAKLYSDASGIPVEQVNATFAGVFATAYLGLEMVTKVLATIIFLVTPDGAPWIIFTVYTAIAVSACFVVAGLSDVSEKGTWDFSCDTISANVAAAGKLVYEDIRLLLMIPFQISFGFASSFVPYYVFGTVIADSDSLGSTYVGLLSAIIVLTGASMAIPAAWLSNKIGKPFVMSIGGACLAFAGFAFLILSDKKLGTWGLIIPYLIIYGMGRGTWENTNKAVIADLFVETPELSTSAFAAISFSNGFAGAIGYFTFGSMGRIAMASLVMISSLVAIACYLLSAHIHSSRTSEIAARLAKYNT